MTKLIPQPQRFMENPYIGRDGRDYDSVEALFEADNLWIQSRRVKKEGNNDLTPRFNSNQTHEYNEVSAKK